jgi:hypothetical protein
MYAKDTDGLVRVRLIKPCEFPMGTICCHVLTFTDAGRLQVIIFDLPPNLERQMMRLPKLNETVSIEACTCLGSVVAGLYPRPS